MEVGTADGRVQQRSSGRHYHDKCEEDPYPRAKSPHGLHLTSPSEPPMGGSIPGSLRKLAVLSSGARVRIRGVLCSQLLHRARRQVLRVIDSTSLERVRSSRRINGRGPEASYSRAGTMLLLSRNKFSGSYFCLSARNRVRLSPNAAATRAAPSALVGRVEVEIGAAVAELLRVFDHIAHPCDVRRVFTGIGPVRVDAQHVARAPVAEGRIGGRDAIHRTADQRNVNEGHRRRPLRSDFHDEVDGVIGEVVEVERLPVAGYLTLREERVERCLHGAERKLPAQIGEWCREFA